MPICANISFLLNGEETFHEIALLDTGNNYQSLISREILERNNISYCPVRLNAYSVDLKKVNIIGRVELKFNFKGSKQVLKETFLVPEVTSKIVNLGSEFLIKNRINILLEKNMLELGSELISLHSGNDQTIVNEVNKIPLFTGELRSEIPDKSELPGIQYGANETGTLKSQKFNVVLKDKIQVHPGGSTILVKMAGADPNLLWYLSPSNSKMTSGNNFMVIEGIYRPNADGCCLVNVVSAHHKSITLLSAVKVGQGYELEPRSTEKVPETKIISQVQNEKERIIGICSKKCNAAERNYPSYKGELDALVYALKQFLHFARFRPFEVRTDSISLVHYKRWSKNSINGVTFRWITFKQSFIFSVEHRKGSLHVNADALSSASFKCKINKF